MSSAADESATMAKMAAVLQALGGNDNQQRSSAEAFLKSAMKVPSSLVSMLQYIDHRSAKTSPGDSSTIALAAIILSRHVPMMWCEFTPEQKKHVFRHILNQFTQYTSQTVLQSLAELANTVAQSAAGEDNFLWSDLVDLALKSSQVQHCACVPRRIVSFKLLGMLLESLGGRMIGHYQHAMHAVITALSQDPSHSVRSVALLSTSVALGASEFFENSAAHLLSIYFDYTWKLLEFAERSCGRVVPLLFSTSSDSSPQAVSDAVAVLTALATNIRTSSDADSGILAQFPDVGAKFESCHKRACKLCLQVLRKDFSRVGSQHGDAPEPCADFLKAIVLLLGSIQWQAGRDAVSNSAPAASQAFGSPSATLRGGHASSSSSMSPTIKPAPSSELPSVDLLACLVASVKLIAMMLLKCSFVSNEQVRWSYRDLLSLSPNLTDIDSIDASLDPCLNHGVVLVRKLQHTSTA